MTQIIAVHSFRGGTGKSNITANIATVLAHSGQRVGVIDTDMQSPGVHTLFGLAGDQVKQALNQYLWGEAKIDEIVYDVTPNLGQLSGAVHLIPSSIRAADIARVLKARYDDRALRNCYKEFLTLQSLDTLVIDTHPGLNEETLLSLAVAQAVVVILRPDSQDFEGTSVLVEIARRLRVQRLLLVVNKTPPLFDMAQVRARVEQAYQCEVAAVLPHSDEWMMLSSDCPFVVRYPQHPLSTQLRQMAKVVSGI
jgi:septum site-determining protein MinD